VTYHCGIGPGMGVLARDPHVTAWKNSGTLLFTPPFLVIFGGIGGLLTALGAPAWVPTVFGLTMLPFSLVNDFAHDAFHVRRHTPPEISLVQKPVRTALLCTITTCVLTTAS